MTRHSALWQWLHDVALPVVSIVSLAYFAMACTPLPRVAVQEPTTAKAAPPPRVAVANGAIYQAAAYRPIFEDPRPRFVGDILTINISEKFSASQQKNTSTSKVGSVTTDSTNIQLPIGIFQGLNGIGVSGGSSNKFDGKGSTASDNSFTGTITVTVIDVLPNGNMVVSGEKQIGNNQQVETIRFSGVVNPITILAGNVVSSAQVADARIELRGQGAVDEAQVLGWLGRFFLSFLPF